MGLPMPPDRPTDEVLRRFLAGELPEAELEAVGCYLRDHPAAAADLDAAAGAADPFLAALRSAPAVADLDAQEVRDLIERLTPPAGVAPVLRAQAGVAPVPAADPDPTLESDLTRLGGYRLIRVLGRGGMGIVYEAEDPRLGRRVALKVLAAAAAREPGAKERFLREARAAAAVEHDHITPVYHVGEDGDLPFMAMSLLHGETLEARLRAGPVPLPEAVLIARQAAEGLAAAHARGLVHRDVKPSNIWLERHPDGAFKRVRLLDFGLAKPVAPGDAEITGSGVVMGTPAYMAPEQARGLPTDHRADLFSLGVVLYRMAAGCRPFDRADTFAVLTALVMETPKPPAELNPAVPAALSDLVMRLLEKDPARRPQTARAVADELAAIAVGLPADGAAPAPPRPALPMPTMSDAPPIARPAAPPRRWVGRPAAIAAVVALLAAVVLYAKTLGLLVAGEGELTVDADAPGVKVVVKDARGGLREWLTGETAALPAGEATVTVTDPPQTVLLSRTVTVPRAGKAAVQVTAAEVATARRPAAPELNNGPTTRARYSPSSRRTGTSPSAPTAGSWPCPSAGTSPRSGCSTL
jgi:hypothetical protein